MKKLLDNIAWSLWRYKKITYACSYVFFLSVMLWMISAFNTSDSLELIQKIISHLQLLADRDIFGKWFNFSLTFLIPALLTVIASSIFKYYLFPANISNILECIRRRPSSEVAHLARRLIKKEVRDIEELVDGACNGVAIPTYKVQEYADSIVAAAKTKNIYMTTLKNPAKMDTNMQNSTEAITKKLIEAKKKITRIVVANMNVGDLKTVLWFMDLHGTLSANISVKLIPVPEFSALLGQYPTINKNKVDVLLFDGSVLFAVENNPITFEINLDPSSPIPGEKQYCRLHLIDREEILTVYKDLFNDLNNSKKALTVV